MTNKKGLDKIGNWIKMIVITGTLITIIWTAVTSLIYKLVWQSDWQNDKKDILIYIKENEILRREENICRQESNTEETYTLCMERFERERDLRTQEWFR